eukprot:8934587-Pyramimonas_sp.AAC.1
MATGRRHARSRRPGLAVSYATSIDSLMASSRCFRARRRDGLVARSLKEPPVLLDHVAARRGARLIIY